MRHQILIASAIVSFLACTEQVENTRARPSSDGEGLDGYLDSAERQINKDRATEAEIGSSRVRFPAASTTQDLSVRLSRLKSNPSLSDEQAIQLSSPISDILKIEVFDSASRIIAASSDLIMDYELTQKLSLSTDENIGAVLISNPDESAQVQYLIPQSELSIERSGANLVVTNLAQVTMKLRATNAIVWLVIYQDAALEVFEVATASTIITQRGSVRVPAKTASSSTTSTGDNTSGSTTGDGGGTGGGLSLDASLYFAACAWHPDTNRNNIYFFEGTNGGSWQNIARYHPNDPNGWKLNHCGQNHIRGSVAMDSLDQPALTFTDLDSGFGIYTRFGAGQNIAPSGLAPALDPMPQWDLASAFGRPESVNSASQILTITQLSQQAQLVRGNGMSAVKESISLNTDPEDIGKQIVIDRDGNVHVMYVASQPSVYYAVRSYSGGAWNEQRIDGQLSPYCTGADRPDIYIDRTNHAHIVYRCDDTSITYVKKATTTTYERMIANFSSGANVEPQIMVTSNDDIYVAYGSQENPEAFNLRILKRAPDCQTNCFSTWLELPHCNVPGVRQMSWGADADGYLHLSCVGHNAAATKFQIHYYRISPAGIFDRQLVFESSDTSIPVTIYQNLVIEGAKGRSYRN